MVVLLEALGVAAVAAPLVYLMVRLWRRRARWHPFYRSTDASTVQVGLERSGSADIEIADLDPHADDFSQQLAAARADASEKAAALNAAQRI
jgi:hypothetical protein